MRWVYDYLAQGCWFRRTGTQCQFSLDTHHYNTGKDLGNQTVEISFDAQPHEFKYLLEDESQEIHLAAQVLTKTDLMGELVPLVALPAYQLALPFSRPT